jgi:mannose-6-phosphate isomerase-like protein (cupin superfamily)
VNSVAVIERFEPRELGPKSWGIELLVAETPHYTGKVMWMNAGSGGALQYHERKDEAFYLFSGRAIVRYQDSAGNLHSEEIEPGDAFHIPPGAVHQVEAITDCVIFEASTPVFDDRVKVG